MDKKLRVAGQSDVYGEVRVNGSKNSILALIPGMCLGEGSGIIKNSPVISDIDAMREILRELNLEIHVNGDEINIVGEIKNRKLSPKYVSRIRASNLFLGVLLSKFGKAEVPFSGGDRIGDRPLDIHFYIFNKFGITTEVKDGYINCQASQFPYEGQKVYLRYPSVGATENAMFIASTATTPSTIYNVAMEPEIVDLSIMLNKMGASISGAGTPVLHIKPAEKLMRVEHEVIPDRLEAGTFLFLLSAVRGKGIIKNVVPEHLLSAITILSDAGIDIKYTDDEIIVDATHAINVSPLNVTALPYPGFPTDLQPFATVFASTCNGQSIVMDSVHRERFGYLNELRRMGLICDHKYDQVSILGPQNLTGTDLTGLDIRMTMALILAGIIAKGESTIYGIEHMYRGYDNFINKLSDLNIHAKIDFE